MIGRLAIFGFLCLCLAAPAVPGKDAAVEVSLVDGTARSGSGLSLEDGLLKLAGGEAGQWPLEDVVRVEFRRDAKSRTDGDAPGEAPPGWIRVSGGTIRGTVRSFDGRTFTVADSPFGPLELTLRCVRAIGLGRISEMPGTESREGQDVLLLANGDRLRGTVNRIGPEKVVFESDLGALELDRPRVASITLAAPAGDRPQTQSAAVRIALSGGTSVELMSPVTEGTNLHGELVGGPRVSVAMARVAHLAVVAGRLVPLEALEPVAFEQQSLEVLDWPLRRGRSATGGPMELRVRGRNEPARFHEGLGLHGPCRVEYRLDGSFEQFAALVGVDESAGRWADANVVVRVDGKEVFRADHIRWREPAREVSASLAGAKRLELVVELGEHFDVQDRINWARARLIRKAHAQRDE